MAYWGTPRTPSGLLIPGCMVVTYGEGVFPHSSARVAMAKHRQLSGLNDRDSILTVPGPGAEAEFGGVGSFCPHSGV